MPATVTDRSCIASSRADCVLGVARLISSARTRLAKTGPRWNSNRRPPSGVSSMTLVPIMSAGIRSGVNWMRWNLRCRASASVRTSSVLPSPGTPFEQHVAAGDQGRQRVVDDLARGRRSPCRPRGAALRNRPGTGRAVCFDLVGRAGFAHRSMIGSPCDRNQVSLALTESVKAGRRPGPEITQNDRNVGR